MIYEYILFDFLYLRITSFTKSYLSCATHFSISSISNLLLITYIPVETNLLLASSGFSSKSVILPSSSICTTPNLVTSESSDNSLQTMVMSACLSTCWVKTYSIFHALPINSIHKPLISIKIEFSSKVLILSLFIVEMFDF